MYKKIFNIVGMMTGTSMDGIDISMVKTDGNELVKSKKNFFYKYENGIRDFLLNLYTKNIKEIYNEKLIIDEIITLEHFNALKQSSFLGKAEIIGFHGQTIYHNPKKGVSLQLGNPNILSKLTKKKVIFNFRDSDIKNNGQGAPLAPIYHKFIVTDLNLKLPTCIINIGGISNLTYVDENKLIGFDTGPGNNLIDNFVRSNFNLYYDNNGMIASKGISNDKFVKNFMNDNYFKLNYPKSLDNNYFKKYLKTIDKLDISLADKLSTLLECTIQSIVKAILELPKDPKNIMIVGGGYKNKRLVNRLKSCLKKDFLLEEDLNFSSDFIESELIAFLSARIMNSLPTTFPSTTGVKKPTIGGKIYF